MLTAHLQPIQGSVALDEKPGLCCCLAQQVVKAGRCCTAFELNPAKSRPLDISPVSLAVAFLVPTNPFRAQSLHHPARSQLVVLASTRLLPVLPDLSDTVFATGFIVVAANSGIKGSGPRHP